MKIIGKSGKDQYIVDMSSDEVARIAGKPSDYHKINIEHNKEKKEVKAENLEVGSIIDISKIYEEARTLLVEW